MKLKLFKENYLMKIIFVSVLFVAISAHNKLYSQTLENVVHQGITYSPEIPDSSSYEVVKNTTNEEITNEILLKINSHRRANEDYLWVVDNSIEILIYQIIL